MMVELIAFKTARNNAQKGDAVAVFGVEVGMDLKNETRKALVGGFYHAGIALATLRRWRNFAKGIE